MVMGYPLGQHRIKSSIGVVSGREASRGQAFIQMTAPINPGSSGGPLLNEYGQVVGITLAMILDTQNVGYAIAVNELKQLLDRLYTQKLVRMPILGAQFLYANDRKADYLKNPTPAGLYISKVLKGSLFERAGLKEGDMVYEFNGFAVDAYGDIQAPWGADKVTLTELIARVQLGQTVGMIVYRNGSRKEVQFVMELMPEYPVRTIYPDYEAVDYEIFAGMVVMQLADNHFAELLPTAPDLVRYGLIDQKMKPVLVITNVFSGSLGNQVQSLAAGDIISSVNEVPVETLEQLRNAFDKSLNTGGI
jgi:S1-C subfamily serine protease